MIYFIQAIDGGPIKIGKTIDIKMRLYQLSRKYKKDLRVLGVIDGYTEKEDELHFRFWPLHLGYEWFTPSQELLDLISSEAKSPETLKEELRKLPIEDSSFQPTPYKDLTIDDYLMAGEVAEIFEVIPRTLNRWIKSGYFPGAIRRNPRAYNSTYIVPRESVEKFKQERASTEPRKD